MHILINMESFCVIMILLIVVSMSQYNCEQICLQLPNNISTGQAFASFYLYSFWGIPFHALERA